MTRSISTTSGRSALGRRDRLARRRPPRRRPRSRPAARGTCAGPRARRRGRRRRARGSRRQPRGASSAHRRARRPGAERISSRPPSRCARSSIEVRPEPARAQRRGRRGRSRRRRRRPRARSRPSSRAQPDARRARPRRGGARCASASWAMRSTSRSRRRSPRDRGVVERRARSPPAAARRSTSTCLRSAPHRPSRSRSGGRSSRISDAQLLQRLAAPARCSRPTCSRAAAGVAVEQRAGGLGASSTRPNSFWLTASCSSSASRLRSASDRQLAAALVQPRVGDRDRGVRGEQLDQLLVGVAEVVGALLVGQVEGADHALGRDDRHAEERAHVGVPARPPAAEARVRRGCRAVRYGSRRLEHRAEQRRACAAAGRARAISSSLMPGGRGTA